MLNTYWIIFQSNLYLVIFLIHCWIWFTNILGKILAPMLPNELTLIFLCFSTISNFVIRVKLDSYKGNLFSHETDYAQFTYSTVSSYCAHFSEFRQEYSFMTITTVKIQRSSISVTLTPKRFPCPASSWSNPPLTDFHFSVAFFFPSLSPALPPFLPSSYF